jgi:hypothetical protein
VAAETSTPALKPVKSQKAVRETGYASGADNSGSWWSLGEDDVEQAPELRWPLNIPIYDRMRREDAQVGSVLRAVVHPIRRTGWSVDPNGARDEVVRHVARDLNLPVRGEPAPVGRLRDRFSWSDHLRHALLMLPFGHMAFEQTYREDPYVADLWHIRKLGPRMPRTISKFNVARDGGLISIEQKATGAATSDIPIPITRLVMYVNEREAGNWAGTSLLRPAYKNWLIKDRLLRVQAGTVERNGMGIPVYEASGTNPDGTDASLEQAMAELDAGADLAQALRSGDNSGLGTPKGAAMKLMGVTGTLPDADTPIRYHDEQIARAVLAHFLNLGTQTGSWALGSTFAEFFTESLQAVAQDVADVTTAHVVEDLVDINWGQDEPAPRIVFDEIGSQQLAIAQAIKMLVDSGVLTADEGLEAHVRLGLKLPVKSDSKPE